MSRPDHRDAAEAALLATLLVAALLCASACDSGASPDARSTPSPGARSSPATTGSAAPDGSTAHLFIDANGGTCTRDAEGDAVYVDAAACSSLNAAYVAASVGDDVRIKGGTYGAQTILWASRKADGSDCDAYDEPDDLSDCITFQPVTGESVTFNGATSALEIQAPYVHLKNVALTDSDTQLTNFGVSGGLNSDCSNRIVHDVIVEGITSDGFFLDGETDTIALIDSVFSGLDNDASKVWECASPATHVPTRILFDGVVMHDYTETDPSAHMEFIHWRPSRHVIIRNSKFYNGSQYNILFQASQPAQGTFQDMLLENNFFGATCKNLPGSSCTPFESAFPLVQFTCQHAETGYERVDFRFNTVEDRIYMDDNSGGACVAGWDVDVVGNQVGLKGSCALAESSGATFEENFGVDCGSGDQLGTIALADPDPPAYDMHTATGSTAIDAVPTSVTGGCPPTDYDGQTRPRRSACDAGADEK